jgi:rSAM/selenodomain-associated transferase 1
MNQAFETLFAQGYTQGLIVGTDTPSLPLERFQQALAALESHDLVLGPALDGGYYLIGLNRPIPGLFTEIPWSTEQVLARTQEKAGALGLKTALLAPWRDVDTIDDLHALIEAGVADAKRPKREQSFSSRTAGALQLLAKRLRTRA